jgi:hypothetical protein
MTFVKTALKTGLVAVFFLCTCSKEPADMVCDNPFDSMGTDWFPPVVVTMQDTTVAIDDTFNIHATGSDSNGSIKKYLWAFDGSVYRDSTDSGKVKCAFLTSGVKTVRVKVRDNDGVVSLADSMKVTVHLYAPVVVAMQDTTVNINDSITITATGTDTNGTVVKYIWAKNSTTFADTTITGLKKTAFSTSGRTVIYVKAIDDDDVPSATDSCVISVTLNPPVVVAMQDTTVNINDSITITATGTDTNGTVAKYIWAKNSTTFADTTTAGAFRVAYTDSGRKVVRVKAIDDDGIASQTDSCIVRVTLDAPLITNVRDTFVAQAATVTIIVTASDTNVGGSVQKYFWDIGVNGWDDSTTVPTHDFSNAAGGPVIIVWAARDDDGLLTRDTFTIVFNRPPSGSAVSVPTFDTSWVPFDWTTGKGTLPFTMNANDSDMPYDTLTYTLSLGNSAGSLTLAYTGKLTQYAAANIDSSDTVYWKLVAKDKYGDSNVAVGIALVPPPPPPHVKEVAAGWWHTIVLKEDGTVVAWGRNDSGQTTVPAGLTGVQAIEGGEMHTVALKRDSTVVAWGGNHNGQTTIPTGLTGVKAIAAGEGHTVALKADGTVVAWGDNYSGQCTIPAGLTGVKAIAAGWWHTVALKEDGTVVAWGYNQYDVSTVPAGLTGVKAIAAGEFNTVALKEDGTVVAWGAFFDGVLNIPAGLTGVKAIAEGERYAVALKGDGIVVAWGNNADNQCTVPVELTKVNAIAAGWSHTIVLEEDGTVVVWGSDNDGQCNVPAGL